MKRETIRRWLVPAVMLLSVALIGGYLYRLQGQDRISHAKLETVTAAVTEAVDTQAMQAADAQKIKRLYGLNPADYAGVVLYYPVTNMDAEELLLVQLNQLSQQETVEAAVQSRLETQKTSFDGYGAEQTALLEESVLEVRGNYILFVVHPEAAAARTAFLQTL